MAETEALTEKDASPTAPDATENVLGADFGGAPDVTPASNADAGAATSGETAAANGEFDPASFDWVRGDVSNVPEQYRHLQGTARKLQGATTRAQQERAEATKQVQDLQREYAARLEQMNKSQPAAATTAQKTALAAMREGMSSEQFADFDQAVNLVRAVNAQDAKNTGGVQQKALLALAQRMKTMSDELSLLKAQPTLENAAALKDDYGEEPDQFAGVIAAMVGQVNPATGRNCTPRQAFETVSGRAFGNAQAQRQASNAAKLQTAPMPAARTGAEDGGPMSRDEALNILTTQFGLAAGE